MEWRVLLLTTRFGKLSPLRHLLWVLLFAAAFGTLGEAPARAQFTWRRVGSFDRSIGCGYFFDADHGLIGTGVRRASYMDNFGTQCGIYKTTNGGTTWTASSLPILFDGAVTSIWMTDTLTGYASITPAVNWDDRRTFYQSSLWKTTNGGDTWFDPYHADHAISSVYAQNGLLITTIWDGAYYYSIPPPDKGGADISFDDGQTWTSMFRRGNGIAFTDSLNGVITEQNANFGGKNFWATFDAGRTWQKTNNQYESWSIYTLPYTGIYFTANESQPSLPNDFINWSTDGGLTWRTRYQFKTQIRFTGTIAGEGHVLYVQTDTTNWFLDDNGQFRFIPLPQNGLFRSDDLGLSWRYVGGPANSRDTRFCVTGCAGEVVYAFDANGGVYKTTDGGDGSIPHGGPYDADFAVQHDTMFWTPLPCGDSLGDLIVSRSCVPFTVDSIVCIKGDLVSKADSKLPKELYQGDALPFSSAFDPTHLGDDTAIVRVYYRAAYLPLTRDIVVFSTNRLVEGLKLSRDTSLLDVPGCVDAEDSILVEAFGCGGMVLDSVITGSDEVTVSTPMPLQLGLTLQFPVHLHFTPDSAGERLLSVRMLAHAGRRHYDTTIMVTARSVEIPMRYIVDTALSFSTEYCRPVSASLTLATPSCDTIWIDSLNSTDPSFALQASPQWVSSVRAETLTIGFNPDSLGPAASQLHLFGHSKKGKIDTIISLSAKNDGVPAALTMTKQALTLNTSVCRPIGDSLVLSNQSCDSLYLDSIVAPPLLFASFDTSKFPMASNDSMSISVRFDPQDNKTRTLPVRLVMHTARRKIDTTVSITAANAIPPNSLILSTDSLWMWTKYCQPITTQLAIFDSGCHPMIIDSMIIGGDTRNEFSLNLSKQALAKKFDSASALVSFKPDTSGQRDCTIHLYLHEADTARDTIIKLRAENHTAPEPYLWTLPTIPAGHVLRIPVMLEPTLDTFSMSSYSFTLTHNTDILNAFGLDFANTCSIDTSSIVTNDEGTGTHVTVKLGQPITHKSDLTKPIVYILDSVHLAPDTLTYISIASFSTDQDAAIVACSVPGGQFAVAPACGDPAMLNVLRDKALTLEITGVSPNPSDAAPTWNVEYKLLKLPTDLSATVYDARGSEVYRAAIGVSAIGKHKLSVPVPLAEGDYFLVLEGSRVRVARKLTVRH